MSLTALFVVIAPAARGATPAPPADEAVSYQPPVDCDDRPRLTRALKRLEEADQADRSGWSPRIAERDAQRLGRVHALIAGARICTPQQHLYAAVILLHGGAPDDHLQAHVLATWAAERGADEARWVSAASYDRWLVSRGLSQWYGTQMRQREGRTCLIFMDGVATDEDRAAKGVPPLAALVTRVAGQAGLNLPTDDLEALDGAGLYCPAQAWETAPSMPPSPSTGR
ncbi:MAG: hypothetical protein Q8P41_17370 [Pseudomonadota bacterium]|nr:hypothetical protein [Pseudomonadota bacterium]